MCVTSIRNIINTGEIFVYYIYTCRTYEVIYTEYIMHMCSYLRNYKNIFDRSLSFDPSKHLRNIDLMAYLDFHLHSNSILVDQLVYFEELY